MRMINRAALIVRYREPFIDWAMNLEPTATSDAEVLRQAVSVYLVPEDPTGRRETPPLKHFYQAIFERELESWWLDAEKWPPKRDLATFRKWFEVTGESIVVDLGTTPIRTDEL